ncbi:hypothetical protein COL55_13280 [Bacillus toyonensis]|uniref:hypothetical protein n=1 Tax=Bacillus toyonensis TaxID=155322 RepID=UPI000BF97E97|nr:hypothetical protein [Bacillus toyonensis]PFY49074.1 hypothetical protein COL55_13280 [Bacillus toyonensis]
MRMYRWRATIQAENPKRLRALKKNLRKGKKPKTDSVYSLETSWVVLGAIDPSWFTERDKKRMSRKQYSE